MKIERSLFSSNGSESFFSTLFSGIKTVAKVAAIALVALPMGALAESFSFSPYLKRFPLMGRQFVLDGKVSCPFFQQESAALCQKKAEERIRFVIKQGAKFAEDVGMPSFEKNGFEIHQDRTCYARHALAMSRLEVLEVPKDRASFLARLMLVGQTFLGDKEPFAYRRSEMVIPVVARNNLRVSDQKIYDLLMGVKNTLVRREDYQELVHECARVGMVQTVRSTAIGGELSQLALEYEQDVQKRVDPIIIAAKVHMALYRIAPFDLPVRTDMVAQLFTNLVVTGLGKRKSIVYPDLDEYRVRVHEAIVSNNSSQFATYLRTNIIPWVEANQNIL